MYSQCYVNIHGLQFVGQFIGFFSYNFFSQDFCSFFFFCKISHDSFAASPNTVKYTREISNVSSTYVKEVWHIVTEHLLGPVKVLHKQLSLRYRTAIPYRQSYTRPRTPHIFPAVTTSIPWCPWSGDYAWQSCLFITFFATKTGLEL